MATRSAVSAHPPGSHGPASVWMNESQLPVPRRTSVPDSVHVVIDDCSVKSVKRSP